MKWLHKFFGVLALSAAVVALSTLAGGLHANAAGQKEGNSGTEVKIDNFTFTPTTVTISTGTTVHWINRDDIPHTVVSEDKTTFKSKALDRFSYTFTKPGAYSYFCSIHPKMTAKIVVQ